MDKIINEKISQWLDGRNKDFLVIAIDGPSAGGKTTIAEDIKRILIAMFFTWTIFFLPLTAKPPKGLPLPAEMWIGRV